MIIELFGPPAVGKTTLARALADKLEKNGFDTQLIMSSRPAEGASIPLGSPGALPWLRTALLAPLSRTAKLVGAAPVLLSGARSDRITSGLMDLLPPRTLLWSVRYRRFLCLLSRSWTMASISDRIVIFDQGFMTALCSMALLARSVDRSIILRGLALIPRPSLLIRLDAPQEILEARLRTRLGRQGALERLFEFDLRTSLQQIEMTGEVDRLIDEQGGRIVRVSSIDSQSLEQAVGQILREIDSWDEEPHSIHRSGPGVWRFVGVAG